MVQGKLEFGNPQHANASHRVFGWPVSRRLAKRKFLVTKDV
jgi:hypothetical protein